VHRGVPFASPLQWQLARDGIRIGGAAPELRAGNAGAVQLAWTRHQAAIETWAAHFGVPVELIIATMVTENGSLDPEARKVEPRDVSVGLMQTLVGTARDMLPGDPIDETWLKVPSNSIKAGTAYIAKKSSVTNFDPPLVAASYNAGSLRPPQGATTNRWNLHCTPRADAGIADGCHIDVFVQWFNVSSEFFGRQNIPPEWSFTAT
jgi:soluble lytic murein transglycosylase-like protein